MIFRIHSDLNITHFITYIGLILAIFNSYTSSISAKLAFKEELFSHHLNFRLILLLPTIIFTHFLFDDNLYTIAVFVGFFNFDFLIPYLSREDIFYKRLLIARFIGVFLFLIFVGYNIFVSYVLLVIPTFLIIFSKFTYSFLRPNGRIYNIVTTIIIISYTQLNYFLPIGNSIDLTKFGLYDRSINLLVPFFFSLRLSKTIELKLIWLLILTSAMTFPIIIDLYIYKSKIEPQYFILMLFGLISGYVNAKAVYWLSIKSKEKYIFLLIVFYLFLQTLFRFAFNNLLIVYILFFLFILITTSNIKKLYNYDKKQFI